MDYSAPRAMFDKLPAYAQRATWAHQNSFEVFSLFAASALMVLVSGKSSESTTVLILGFLAARLAFSFFYIINVPILRSLMWAVSMVVIASLIKASLS